jgi:hypothetical protein
MNWLLLALGMFGLTTASAVADEPGYLWQIGQADNSTADLALGPKDYQQYKEDPLYVIGLSEAKRDWPYVLPGPGDGWAEGRPHEAAVMFSLKQKPTGDGRLVVDLVDTQGQIPPKLSIRMNGRELAGLQMPKGAGDASVFGEPDKGREHRFTVDVPADALVAGTNELAIRTLSGSWVLFDWLGLETPAGAQLGPAPTASAVHGIQSAPVLIEKDGQLWQTVRMTVRHFGEPARATVFVQGAVPAEVDLKTGATTVEVAVPAVQQDTPIRVEAKVGDKTLAAREVTLTPVRKFVLYLLPHSHVDIGYTQVQTEVEQNHWKFYEQAIEAAQRTADYPAGAAFKWNAEVLWATDSYLKQATAEKQQAFLDAVRKGRIGLDALYGNELTALCRPEELVRLVEYAGQVSEQTGVPIDSAMISDVPGYTWGLMTVLAEAGVKYFSVGPNGGHRIGYTLQAWGDKPFWWTTPSGQKKVLVWIPRTGYYRAFTTGEQVLELVRRVEENRYPYDLIQIRYCLGDNAGPGLNLSELVKEWNTKYAYPKLVIATTSEMMRDFERRYGETLPVVRGDFTPYWEDGAASSSLETGLNRAAAERLSQAEALWSILQPATYPTDEFYAAWRDVILYDEHTWGAHNSISQPDSEFAKSQWAIKQAFALNADQKSRKLLSDALKPVAVPEGKVESLLVFNTSGWPRTDLVVLPKDMAVAGDAVRDPQGQPVPSQRLATGELAFLAGDVPPFGADRFTLASGEPAAPAQAAKAEVNMLANAMLAIRVDEKTGDIGSFKAHGIDADLVNAADGLGLNAYRYVAGRSPAEPQPNGPVTITVRDRGPLVASLSVESAAPGCRKLTRELRLVAGSQHVDIANVVDKEPIRTPESVHFGFALHVPQGVMRMDTPLAVVRPEEDQMPGACKNYFTVSRWVDVSNEQYGVTWATVDAPLVEVGAIRVDVPRPFGLEGWVEHLEPSQTFYSYVMNNYWETNYKADQAGPTPFRYALRPRTGGYCPVDAARFGTERSQPLVAVPAAPSAPARIASRFELSSRDVIASALRPSRDGRGIIIRLFNVTAAPAKTSVTCDGRPPAHVWLSDFQDRPCAKADGPIDVPPYGLVTLRIER